MKKISFILVTIIILISFTSCKKNIVKNNNTLVVCLGSEPTNFNINLAGSTAIYPASNIMSHLIGRDDMNNYVNDLTDSWSISEDGMEYTFHLVKNVKWHDNQPFSSMDVKWTFEEIINKKGLLVDRLDLIDTIKCSDDNTVVFKLREPDASFLSIISAVLIMPKHIYEGTDWSDNPANIHPIGTGPYKFVEYKRGTSITLEANNDYFRGRPKIDKLVYKIIPDENTAVQAFKNGEVDILDYSSAVTPSAVPELEMLKGVKVVKSISTSRQYIAFNLKKEPFSDLKVRQAISLAVDRDEIVKKAHKGYAQKAEGFYTPAVGWAYNDKDVLPGRDVYKAKKLLEEAGYLPDKDGIRIKDLNIVTFYFPAFADIARVVQENLKEIGIESKITMLEYSTWEQQVKKGDFDLVIIGGDQGCDPESLSVRIGSRGFINVMGYSNDKIDNLLEKGRKTFRQDERANIYKEIQRVMSEELPIVPLSEWMYIVVMRDYISGHPIDDGLGRVPSAQYSLLKIDK